MTTIAFLAATIQTEPVLMFLQLSGVEGERIQRNRRGQPVGIRTGQRVGTRTGYVGGIQTGYAGGENTDRASRRYLDRAVGGHTDRASPVPTAFETNGMPNAR